MANDGKYLEKLVTEYYDGLALTSVVCKRLPDATAARHGTTAQNADFLISTTTTGAFHLECKSVGGKKPILKKFRQYPTMRRWALAGTYGYVLVHFYDLGKIALVGITDLNENGGTVLNPQFNSVVQALETLWKS
jgi:hypothetical protein